MGIEEQINQLKELVEKQSKLIEEQGKLITTMAKALYLIPVTKKEVSKIQGVKSKNAKVIQEAYHDISQNMSIYEHDSTSLFKDPIYSDSDLFNDVIADDLLGGFYETKWLY